MKKIVLCGSTRFRDDYGRLVREFSLRGYVVYTVAAFGHAGDTLTEEDKLVLDAVHLRKIVESDVVYVINRDSYIGESTRREVYFAKIMGKELRFMVHDSFACKMMAANFRDGSRPCPSI